MDRFLYSVDETSARFISVRSDSIEMQLIRATLGQIESSQQTLPQSEIDKNVKMALSRGFQEVSESDFLKAQATVEQEFRELIVDRPYENTKLVAWEELAKNNRDYFSNNPAEYLSPQLQNFCVCDEHYHSESSLSLGFDSMGPSAQTSRRNLIFSNGLTIDGDLDAGELTTELPLFLLVKGDLKVRNVMLSGWAEVVVTGDLIVTGDLLGFDGESGGRLKVYGNLSANNVVGGMMYHMEIDGEVHGKVYWLDNDEPLLEGATIVPFELTQEEFRNRPVSIPVLDKGYFGDSNWATGEEVITYHFEPSQSFAVLRKGEGPA